MIDPGWDLWDAKRVRTALWPSTEEWPDGDELWSEVAISPPDEVSVLVALSAQNERLEAQVAKLTTRVARQDERIATLERQLGRSSKNFSQPPSADPPGMAPRRGKDPSAAAQKLLGAAIRDPVEVRVQDVLEDLLLRRGPSEERHGRTELGGIGLAEDLLRRSACMPGHDARALDETRPEDGVLQVRLRLRE